MSIGITVNQTSQTVESAASGGVFHIEDVYPLIDGGRFPVKRIAGESIEVWADIYRDGHDVVSAGLIWRCERDRRWRRGGFGWGVRGGPKGGGGADDPSQQRSLVRFIRPRSARPLRLCHRSLD